MSLGDVVADIADIRSDYIRDRAVFVEGSRVSQILERMGAVNSDIEKLKLLSDGLRSDPTLPFRKSKKGRFCFDSDALEVYRLEPQPFVLSAEEDFVRHDSGQVRLFDELDDYYPQNSAIRALLKFKFMVFNEVAITHRPKLDYGSKAWVCTLFNLRTETNAQLLGEPALEGVHSDGVDHTMTVLLGSTNMSDDSAATRIHDVRETNGLRWGESDPQLILGEVQHRHFLDTLLLVDHERKHSVSALHARDSNQSATRDMLVAFTRKPVVKGHASFPYDSLKPHPESPMLATLE